VTELAPSGPHGEVVGVHDDLSFTSTPDKLASDANIKKLVAAARG
jgi:hypothetical protein